MPVQFVRGFNADALWDRGVLNQVSPPAKIFQVDLCFADGMHM